MANHQIKIMGIDLVSKKLILVPTNPKVNRGDTVEWLIDKSCTDVVSLISIADDAKSTDIFEGNPVTTSISGSIMHSGTGEKHENYTIVYTSKDGKIRSDDPIIQLNT